MLHQSDAVLTSRVKDVKSFASYIRRIQAECESHYSKIGRRNAQTVDVVVLIKPGNRSRFWLVCNLPLNDPAQDERLVQELKQLKAPAVEGPVSFSMRLLLWGALEPDPWTPRNLFLPREWREAIGTNQNVPIPDGILPKVWPD